MISEITICRYGMCLYLFLLIINTSYGAQSDVTCLKSIKESMEDPLNSLYDWKFSNDTNGFICRFNGIECWNEIENRVLSIRLSEMGLKGEFPRGVVNCTSLTGVDLSSNELNGIIPSDISTLLPFLTTLDLSSNNFTGTVPANLANCSYLNVLKLDNNQLSGQIPPELAWLSRIKTFNVTNNHLCGPVPQFKADIPADSYSGNPGLCGKPLPDCKASSNKNNTEVHYCMSY